MSRNSDVRTSGSTTVRRSLLFSLVVAALAWGLGVVVFGAAELVVQLTAEAGRPIR
jgi:hypothetical protein